MATIRLVAGDRTEDLVSFIAGHLTDDELDRIEIERQHAATPGLASEPVTTAVLITVTPIIAATVARLLERWLESRRQDRQLQVVLSGFKQSDEAGRYLADLVSKHADVSVAFGQLPTIRAEPESPRKKR